MQHFQDFSESNLKLEKILLSLEVKALDNVLLQALAKRLCSTQEVCFCLGTGVPRHCAGDGGGGTSDLYILRMC